ncbi:5-formyltetrahydrofolate cyclo-ligase [Rarobacter incanus]|uniref:5-formyltetrahydrofolate cyclo-ligase n=1 Tax=Rarobacter incanus TaxID=153494 RepID=A0A542SNW7_9MICO|nr:5-formyltetrahydrofolate cyclo-ligase [Rarobacter incanus]TQK76310.1 5-formyltetrahydrofolate cyclo-ligase [Rarobacter incanus]
MTGQIQHLPDLGGLEPEDAKSVLRSTIREHRATRSARRRTDAGDAIGIIGSHLATKRADKTVALYASRPTEPSTGALLERLSAAGIRVLLPVLGDGLKREWGDFNGLSDLVERAPGRPPEPSGQAFAMQEVASATLVLVPALCVDTSGCRLGQGGGWYDRVLEHVSPDALVLAVVFPDEVFNIDEFPVPREPHDAMVHGALTPQGVNMFIP